MSVPSPEYHSKISGFFIIINCYLIRFIHGSLGILGGSYFKMRVSGFLPGFFRQVSSEFSQYHGKIRALICQATLMINVLISGVTTNY